LALVDQAYSAIKRSVIDCELEPGESITEEQLAVQYGVGRAAVRAALKRLTQEKLVDVGVRQRYSVTPLTLRHVNELFAVRALLEPEAARLAAGRINAEHLRRLDELCQARYVVGDASSARISEIIQTEALTALNQQKTAKNAISDIAKTVQPLLA
jgi:DNA-binding GntR family transcriptional regulator